MWKNNTMPSKDHNYLVTDTNDREIDEKPGKELFLLKKLNETR